MFRIRVLSVWLAILSLVALQAGGQENPQWPTPNEHQTVMYVSTDGNDAWSGKLAAPNNQHSDGPFASLEAARDAIRNLKANGPLSGPVIVYVRGGTYPLAEPLVFTAADSGTKESPIRYAAYRGETPVLSGGRQITGWRKSRNGKIWQTQVPGVKQGEWYPHQLFVNGCRRQRARTPNAGFFQMDGKLAAGKELMFKFHSGDIKPEWGGQDDVDIVILQAWTVIRAHIAQVNSGSQTAMLSLQGGPRIKETITHYWIENSLDALDSPGEWYLDRRSGTLYYWPMPGEDMKRSAVIAPMLTELMRFEGDMVGEGYPGGSAFWIKPVHDILVHGLTFSFTDWSMPAIGYADVQAAFNLPAALEASGASSIVIENSVFEHLGQFAIEFGKACKGNRISGNEMADLGAGAVKIGEPKDPHGNEEVTSGNFLLDNRIHDVGMVDPGADAVWVGESSGNVIAHNEISNAFHSGIAVGWTWGYLQTAAYSNLIEFNNIHDIGRGVMGDLGCVYLLGVQPGTVVRNNYCHDVTRSDTSYGGWGFYTDEGSSRIVIENNVALHTEDAGFHHHYGQDDLVRNNIFAFGKNSQLRRTSEEAGHSFDFEHNIVIWDSGTLLEGAWTDNQFHFDDNLYFHAGGGGSSDIKFGNLSLAEWRKRGQDTHSLVADPLFVDPQNGNFALRSGSPAVTIGFKAIDLGTVGPRSERINPR